MILLHIIAGVALLLYGLNLIQDGIMRAFGARLKSFINKGTRNVLSAFLSGFGVTAIVQSSTATSLIVATFADKKLMSFGMALAVLLGADAGKTMIAQILSFDLDFMLPLFIIVGAIGNISVKASAARYVCRSVLGLGLMLLALDLITAAAQPMGDSNVTQTILSALNGEIFLTFLVAILLTWIMHSSLAAVLLIMALAAHDVVSLPVALVFVLGANVGNAIPPVILNLHAEHGGRVVAVGGLIIRFLGALAALLAVMIVQERLYPYLGDTPTRQIVNFHTFFNIIRGVVFLPFVSPISKLVISLLPKNKHNPDDLNTPLYLDQSALNTPSLGLSCAAREVLRMGDVVEDMLRSSINAFTKNDKAVLTKIEQKEDNVDALYTHIKLYITRLSSKGLTKEEGNRAMEILMFVTNMEHIGDILDKSIRDLADKKLRQNVDFTPAGKKELENFHKQVCSNMRLAMNIFISGDKELARKLIREKDKLREMAEASSNKHFKRLRARKSEAIQTSSIHLDLIRDMTRINSHLTAESYNILEEEGELQSRLKISTTP